MEQRLILINLLIKLGVAAAAASALVRSVEFKSLLFRDQRTLKQTIYLMLWITVPMTVSVWARFSAPKSYAGGDLSLETTILLGVVVGRLGGAIGGTLLAIPALFYGQWAVLPLNVLCGVVAGQLRRIAPDREEIWSFSPFIDLSIYRWIRRNLPTPRLFDWQTMFFLTIVVLRFVQTEMSLHFSNGPVSCGWRALKFWVEVFIYATSSWYWDRTEDLEQCPHPDQAGRAGAAAAERPHGSVAKPDQPSFFIQYVEFSFFTGAY